MEVTQRLQPVQDKAYQLFTEVEGQGEELEKVVNAAEQCLEGPVNDEVIQYFAEQEVHSTTRIQRSSSQARGFQAELVYQSDSG
jgi:hypothetical protein